MLILAVCGLTWVFFKLVMPDLVGGLLGYVLGPPVLLTVLTALAVIIAKCFLRPMDGRLRLGAGFGYASLIVSLGLLIIFFRLMNSPHGPSYHGP